MDDDALFHRATEAGYAYREVYGSFPEKIGIHISRLKTFRPCVIFPVPPPPITMSMIMEEPLSNIITQHIVWFGPVAGPGTKLDEVYLPIPGEDQAVRSADQMIRMAKEFSHGAYPHRSLRGA